MQGEHWIVTANVCHKMCLADSLGRQIYSFFQCHREQLMRELLQSHSSVSGFNTLYAAFHIFKFLQESFTGVDDVILLSILGNYM